MNVRLCTRVCATKLLVAVICVSSLTALLLLTSVRSKILQMAESSTNDGDKLEDIVNNEAGDRVEPLNMTLALKMLRAEGSNYKFQWSHWANLANSELYDYGNLDPAFFPHLSTIDDLSQMAMPFKVDTTQREAEMIGELYCRYRMPAPAHIIALPDTQSSNFSGSAEVWSVHHAIPELDHLQYGLSTYTEQTITKVPLALDLISNDSAVQLLPEINNNLFHWDAREAAQRLENGNAEEQARAQMLRSAIARVKTSGKHFEETHILFDTDWLGNHYDWRFFRGIESCSERVKTVQALTRTWSQFTSQFHIEAWWAHGSALGWMWNGLAMPWDTDADIQVPIQTLDRLAWEFNHTLIVQPANEGSRAYLIEVSPWYVERENGNGLNVIDARFIDITTGTYADITGLAYYNSNSQVACKSPHYYWLGELSPLRKTKFEGASAYIPAKFPAILKDEYSEAYNPIFKSWKFNAKSRLWSSLDIERKEKSTYYDHALHIPVELLPWDECNYHLYGTCDRFEIEEYETTKDYTLSHEIEMDLWEQIPIDDVHAARTASAVQSLIELLNIEYPPMHRAPE